MTKFFSSLKTNGVLLGTDTIKRAREIGNHRSGWARTIVVRRLPADPRAIVGLGIVLTIVGLAIAAPLLARYGPDSINPLILDQNPSLSHWFGTDYLGRDMWARVLYGSRVSLLVGVSVVAIEFGIGVPMGLVAGYFGRLADSILAAMIDLQLSLPGLLLPLGVIAVMGPSLRSTVIALGIGGIPVHARLARGTTLKIREQGYVEAARSMGISSMRIMVKYVLPNILDTLLVQATVGLGFAIIAASTLSYLGVGIQPPTPDWGTLLASGSEHMFESWSELAFPGIVVSTTVLGIYLLGDSLSDAFNPRSWR